MAKRKSHAAETEEDKKSKRNLRLFLKLNQQVLEQLFEVLRERLGSRARTTIQRLNTLRVAAFEGQKGIEQFFEKGMNAVQRRVLSELGLMHETLLAKLQLLWDCLGEGSLQPILKTLNSLLGSLAKVFTPLHAVKEFKEMMEVAVDRMGPDSDPIVLRLGALPSLE